MEPDSNGQPAHCVCLCAVLNPLSGVEQDFSRYSSPGTYVHPSTSGARDSETIRPHCVNSFSESIVTKLRPAMVEQLQKPEAPIPELVDRLQDVGKEAREHNIPPEQVIITFKELWSDLLQSRRPQRTDQYDRLRQRLVTHYIQAYYAE